MSEPTLNSMGNLPDREEVVWVANEAHQDRQNPNPDRYVRVEHGYTCLLCGCLVHLTDVHDKAMHPLAAHVWSGGVWRSGSPNPR